MKISKKASAEVIGAAALWGCIGVFFKALTAAGFSQMQAVAMRVTIAAVLFTGYMLVRDREALRIRFRDIPYFMGTGILSLAFFNICYFYTIRQSGLSVAAVLLYTSPIFVALFSAALFGEKLTGRKCLALAMTFLGCVFVTGVLHGGNFNMIALLSGLGSGIGYALYSIFGKLALKKYAPMTVTAYTFIFAAVSVLPFAGVWEIPGLIADWQTALAALCIGVLCCVLPYVLYTSGLNRLEPGRAAILATVEPVVAAILDVTVYHAAITLDKTAGVLLVVAAVVVLNTGAKTKDDT